MSFLIFFLDAFKIFLASFSHGLVSGAEEKIVRAFESPQMFMTNHGRISGGVDSRPAKREAQGASVPSLGLSNKPVLFNEDGDFNKWSVPEDERHVKDKFPDFYFNPETHNKPPPEVSSKMKCVSGELFFTIQFYTVFYT